MSADTVETKLPSWTGPIPVDNVESMMQRVGKLLDAGEVKRLHAVPTLRQHTIAEHVYGSLVIAVELTRLNRTSAAREATALSLEKIMMALLLHDAPEVATGDIPAPVKRRSAMINAALESMEKEFYADFDMQLPELNEVESAIVRASDALDLATTCLQERMMGSRHPVIQRVFMNTLEYASELKLVGIEEMRSYFEEVWEAV